MNRLSASVKALLSALVIVAGLCGCTSSPSPGTDASSPATTVSAPEPSPNPMATLNGLSVYVASTGVQILDQSLVTGPRLFDVPVPDGVTQIGFVVMCESASQGWTVSADGNELGWTSPDTCPTKAVFSDIVDVPGSDDGTITVQVGLDDDSYLALVAYAAD